MEALCSWAASCCANESCRSPRVQDDPDHQAADHIVVEQVALGRQQGRLAVPDVATAVMQAIEELKGRSLTGSEVDHWLH